MRWNMQHIYAILCDEIGGTCEKMRGALRQPLTEQLQNNRSNFCNEKLSFKSTNNMCNPGHIKTGTRRKLLSLDWNPFIFFDLGSYGLCRKRRDWLDQLAVYNKIHIDASVIYSTRTGNLATCFGSIIIKYVVWQTKYRKVLLSNRHV